MGDRLSSHSELPMFQIFALYLRNYGDTALMPILSVYLYCVGALLQCPYGILALNRDFGGRMWYEMRAIVANARAFGLTG
jgi:hypothetical protein